MKTIKKVQLKLKVCEYMPELSEMEENVIYYSQTFEIASHKCLCGVNHECVTPIGVNGWSIEIINSDNFTMKPSILNNPCKCHYIVTNGIANIV